MANFFNFFIHPAFLERNLFFVSLIIITFFLLLFYVPLLSRVFLPNFGYKRSSGYMPFDEILNDNQTIKLKDGSLVRIFLIKGIQNNNMDPNQAQQLFELKQNLFNQIKDNEIILRFYTIRNSVENDADDYEFDQPVLQRIYNRWKNQGLKIFKNKHYLVLSVYGKDALDRIDGHTNVILSILSTFGVKVMKHKDSENVVSFFGNILSPVSKPSVTEVTNNMNDLITSDNVEFMPQGVIKYNFGDDTKYASIISVKVAPDFIDSDFFEQAMTLQCEMISMNSFTIHTSRNVERLIRQKMSSESSQITQQIVEKQVEEAYVDTDENIAGSQIFIGFYPMFVIFGKTPEDVIKNISDFKKVSASFGVVPVVEDFASKVSWFSMIPGFNDFPRVFNILSNAAAVSIPLGYIPPGIPNSDWGKGSIVVFPTSSGTPYQFQFHVSDQPGAVGHTLVIGPTGGGKTTLFSFLIAQSLRHPKLKSFFFDRNRGAEIFTLSCGGKYISLENKSQNTDKIDASFKAKLNPLKMEDTESNRAFLRKWFAMLSDASDPSDLDEIGRSVSVIFDYLNDKDKLLRSIYTACFSSGGAVRGSIKKWIDPLQYGDIFNEDMDTLDLFSRLTTFDFTDIIKDETLAPVVISYILHRISSITVSGGNPALIMIDETAPMLENKMFRDNFIVGLQEGRKNRQCYMAAFQQANIIDKLGIGDVVRGQAQTVLFFRNPGASADDYSYWKLNQTELAFIKGIAYPHLKRAVLLSRPITGESVILNTELGGLGNLLKLFESGRPSVLLAEDLYRQFGNNFVDEYLKQTEVKE